MSDELHKGLRRQAALDGFPSPDETSLEDLTVLQSLKMIVCGPEHRTNALEQLDDALADNSVNLRKRAQLLELKRRMSFTDKAMRKAGR